jgi:hydroxymethylpyrimidine kinase/phosphomethylpyrimidine kinase
LINPKRNFALVKSLRTNQPLTLTIAGFDPSCGAGITADIKTFLAFDCAPAAAITSITFQNSDKVFGAVHQTAGSACSQVMAVVERRQVAALKIGMLPTAGLVREVARLIRELKLPAPVVDPVMTSTSGQSLMEESAIEPFVKELMPLARIITPNIPEAEKLSGLKITGESDMYEAAAKLRRIGAHAVLIKGGHLNEATTATDVLDDEGRLTILRGEWIDVPNVRGTGCILSSAIAASLAKGLSLQEAVTAAKEFVASVIRQAI